MEFGLTLACCFEVMCIWGLYNVVERDVKGVELKMEMFQNLCKDVSKAV